jgi:hypothetical protein
MKLPSETPELMELLEDESDNLIKGVLGFPSGHVLECMASSFLVEKFPLEPQKAFGHMVKGLRDM